MIELMIAMTIGILLLLGMSFLMAEQSKDRSEIDRAARQIENGRQAISILTDEVQTAGFFGDYGMTITALTALPDPCVINSASTLNAAMAMPVQGYDVPGSSARPTCIDAANYVAGTDILVVRRAETKVTATPVAGEYYLQTTPIAKTLALGDDVSVFSLVKKDNVTAAPLRRYRVQIYFISPCNIPSSGTTCSSTADNGRPIPTLKRLEIATVGGVATWTTTALVEGVENMQFDYSVDTSGTGVPDYPALTAPSVANWPNVMAIDIYLLARNNEQSSGHADSKVYGLGLHGTVGPYGDRYKRHVYAGTVRVMNPSQRRE